MRLLTAFLLVSLALAGCSEDPAPASSCLDGVDAAGEPCVEVREDTGAIRAVVVDEAIVPLAGVTIRILQGGEVIHESVTDENGAFVLPDLEPGFYVVQAEKLGFEPYETQISVEAGEIPDVLKIRLDPIPGFAPFFNQFVWTGYIQCNTVYANVCLIANYYPDFVLGTGSLTDDASWNHWVEEFLEPGKTPTYLQVETLWDSTQPLGTSLNIRYETVDPDELFIPCVFGSQEGESPQVYAINASRLQDAGVGAPDPAPDEEGCDISDAADGFAMEFFSGDAVGCQSTPVGCYPRAGATVEQYVTVYLTAFYDYAPPEDWTFWETGEVPAPA